MLADPKASLNTHAGHVTRKANKLKEILEENPTLTSVTSKESNSTANEGKRQFNRSIIYYLNIVPIVNDSFWNSSKPFKKEKKRKVELPGLKRQGKCSIHVKVGRYTITPRS